MAAAAFAFASTRCFLRGGGELMMSGASEAAKALERVRKNAAGKSDRAAQSNGPSTLTLSHTPANQSVCSAAERVAASSQKDRALSTGHCTAAAAEATGGS